MNKEEAITIIRTEMPVLQEDYAVKRVGLVGSVVSAESSNGGDVDIIVDFDRPTGLELVRLAGFLADRLRTKVDVITKTGLRSIRRSDVARY